MEIISNFDSDKHSQAICNLLKESKSIKIAVAFLSKTGLNLIIHELTSLLKRGGEAEMIVGLDFYQTDPDALFQLRGLLLGKSILRVVQGGANTFHPKTYGFYLQNSLKVITGSANMTNRGFTRNTELSFLAEFAFGSTSHAQYEEFFQKMRGKAVAENLLDATLQRYKIEHAKRPKLLEKICEEIQQEQEESRTFTTREIGNLLPFLDVYRRNPYFINDWNFRQGKYVDAANTLRLIAKTPKMTKQDFIAAFGPLIGAGGNQPLWHSAGLFRHKTELYGAHNQLVKIIGKLVLHPPSPTSMFDEIKKMADSVPGLGYNILTEILNTLFPDQYPVLNQRATDVLRDEFGFKITKTPNAYTSKTFSKFVDLNKDLQISLGLSSLGQTDHFLSCVREMRKMSVDANRFSIQGNRKVWMKPIGHARHRIPEGERYSDLLYRTGFSQQPSGIQIGDLLVMAGAGSNKVLSIYRVMSLPFHASQPELANNEIHQRWSWSLWALNLTTHYGGEWWQHPTGIFDFEKAYNLMKPGELITAHKDNIQAWRAQKSHFELRRGFSEYLIEEVKRWNGF